MSLDASIIIVSYNTREMTLECIQSIYDQALDRSFEVIVLDNCSSDGSVEAIRSRFPQVNLLDNNENLGFARGNNVAAAAAKGKRIVLLNPDTVILDHAIDRILDFADLTPESKLWGGKAIFADGSINASCWMDMTWWSNICRAFGFTYVFPRSRLFNPESIHMWSDLQEDMPVDIVVGCFLVIDSELWFDLKGFDPTFFMYGDEVDLCMRAKKGGAAPRITPRAKIIHHGGGSEPSSEDKLIKVFKGRVTVMNQHWSPLAAWFGRTVMLLGVGFRSLANAIISSPDRRGGGQDGETKVWRGAFRRRKEWVNGWEVVSR